MRLVSSLVLVSTLLVGVQSVHMPLKSRASQVGNRARRLVARTPYTEELPRRITRVRRAALDSTVSVSDSNDFEYFIDVELGGHSFTVQIDTGSSDLWVATDDTSGLNITDQTAEIQYVQGSAKGPVTFGDLSIAGTTVSQQAFIRVPPSEAFPSSKGLIGLGPSSGSVIFNTVGDTSGLSPLDRAFDTANNVSASFLTVRLGRTADPSVAPTGDLTIGEVLPGFNNVTSTPKLAVNQLPTKDAGAQHWQTLLDPNGIIANGQPITTPTNASANLNSSAKNQLSFIFDTGFTLPQVPGYIADAIYGNITGAVKQNLKSLGEVYVLPCSAEVNVTFSFGGQKIPIHPLDTNIAGFQDNSGNNICVGSFQPALPGVQSPFEDGNLGMAFLRNVYMLINFGDFISGSNAETGQQPYIQLLPTTDPATAHQEFLSVRVNAALSIHQASLGLALSVGATLAWVLAV